MSAARVLSGHHGGRRNFTSDAAPLLSDEVLVAGAKMGDESFFDELHERHRERMFRVARRITRHREDTQDAVHRRVKGRADCILSQRRLLRCHL
jgi:hypothetical protein